MTRERAKELLPVIQAWSEGQSIEVRQLGTPRWSDYLGDHGSPRWDWDGWEWRVKPEPRAPREWWIGERVAYDTYEQAKFDHGWAPIVHVREVIQDCGKGFVSVEQLKPTVKVLEDLLRFWSPYERSTTEHQIACAELTHLKTIVEGK